MKVDGFRSDKVLSLAVSVLTFMALVVVPATGSAAVSTPKQKAFASAEDAVSAFMTALKDHNKKELSAVFGPAMSELSSGDEVSDRADREWFIKAYEDKNFLEKKDDGVAILQVGSDNWPFPIPIVKKGSAWSFDTEAGKEEMLNRRIGRNELGVIEVMHGYVNAQRQYATRDREGGGSYPYAQRIMSTPGKKDGLYWEAKKGEEESPAGPFVAKAAREGYRKPKTDNPSPFHGYYFRILTSQGDYAQGGAYDYVINGNMVLGFGLIAYPAKYGASGIMTFIVNQQGVVYQKDLGRNTGKAAASIKTYNPDSTWKRVERTDGQ